MNTDSRKTARNDFQKDIFKLMNNSVFGKLCPKTQEHQTFNNRNTKKLLGVKTKLLQYKIFQSLLAIETRKTQILINKTLCLGLSILELRETVNYEFQYDYVKPKYGEKAKLC